MADQHDYVKGVTGAAAAGWLAGWVAAVLACQGSRNPFFWHSAEARHTFQARCGKLPALAWQTDLERLRKVVGKKGLSSDGSLRRVVGSGFGGSSVGMLPPLLSAAPQHSYKRAAAASQHCMVIQLHCVEFLALAFSHLACTLAQG